MTAWRRPGPSPHYKRIGAKLSSSVQARLRNFSFKQPHGAKDLACDEVVDWIPVPDSSLNSAVVTKTAGDCLMVTARIDPHSSLLAIGRKSKETRTFEDGAAIFRLPDFSTSDVWDLWVENTRSRTRLSARAIDPRAQVTGDIEGRRATLRAVRGPNGGLSLWSRWVENHFEILDIAMERDSVLLKGLLSATDKRVKESLILEQLYPPTEAVLELPVTASSRGDRLRLSIALEDLRLLGSKPRTTFKPSLITMEGQRISVGVWQRLDDPGVTDVQLICDVVDPLYPDIVDEYPVPRSEVKIFLTPHGDCRLSVRRV